jgi:hypothetical protein
MIYPLGKPAPATFPLYGGLRVINLNFLVVNYTGATARLQYRTASTTTDWEATTHSMTIQVGQPTGSDSRVVLDFAALESLLQDSSRTVPLEYDLQVQQPSQPWRSMLRGAVYIDESAGRGGQANYSSVNITLDSSGNVLDITGLNQGLVGPKGEPGLTPAEVAAINAAEATRQSQETTRQTNTAAAIANANAAAAAADDQSRPSLAFDAHNILALANAGDSRLGYQVTTINQLVAVASDALHPFAHPALRVATLGQFAGRRLFLSDMGLAPGEAISIAADVRLIVGATLNVSWRNSANGQISSVASASIATGSTQRALIANVVIPAGTAWLHVQLNFGSGNNAGEAIGSIISRWGIFRGIRAPASIDADAVREGDYEADQLNQQPWANEDNLARNSLFLANPVGQTNTPPNEFGVTFGGGGNLAANYSIAQIRTPLGTFQALKSDHYNNGTNKTDRQFAQVIDIPPELHGDTTAVLRVVYLARRNNVNIDTGIYVNLGDANHVLLGTPLAAGVATTKLTQDGAVDTWYRVSFNVPITNAAARRVEVRIRPGVLSLAGPIFSGGECFITGLYMAFNKSLREQFYRRNRAYDQLQLTQQMPTRSSVWADARGNVAPLISGRNLVLWGDSQTATIHTAMTNALSDRVVTLGGIGGETSAQIVPRMIGHQTDIGGVSFASSGTKRLRTKRVLPPRNVDETYRTSWTVYGSGINEPRYVEFFAGGQLIGESYNQFRATATVSGATLTATAHPFVNGDEVYVVEASLPANMYRYKTYFVANATANTFELREFSAGPSITFSAFGGSLLIRGGFWFDWSFTVGMPTDITIVCHGDLDRLTWHVCIGTNDVGNNATTAPAIVIANLKAAVAAAKALDRRILISTMPSFHDWIIGDPNGKYNAMVAINSFILSRYSDIALDPYTYLRARGDNGVNDNADIAAGLVPRSLRVASNDGHLNTTGANHWRDLIQAALVARGW